MSMVQVLGREGTSRMKLIERPDRVKVGAAGVGVLSRGGVGVLRKLPQDTVEGLSSAAVPMEMPTSWSSTGRRELAPNKLSL